MIEVLFHDKVQWKEILFGYFKEFYLFSSKKYFNNYILYLLVQFIFNIFESKLFLFKSKLYVILTH
jgi:hypothetical protein